MPMLFSELIITKKLEMCIRDRFEGLKRVEVNEAAAGDIICVSGIADLNSGETICDPECVEPLPFVKIDEPTLSMNFMVNDSPFAGREGTVSYTHLDVYKRQRLILSRNAAIYAGKTKRLSLLRRLQ